MSSTIILKSIRRHVTFPRYGRPPVIGECAVDYKVPFSRKVRLAPSVNSTVTSTNDIRAEFLSFFRENGHILVAPSSVYPKRQEGSYFVNAGMNQFKPHFLRNPMSSNAVVEFSRLKRVTNSQPCIRIGGRHEDLNDVGYDTYHHTMFEMLGNWSFGDYGKETACRQMWQFLTGVLGLPPSSLYVTYFGGSPEFGLPADDETRDIWLNLGVSDQKLMAFGAESNFWRADQASGGGLCGPCTEIHVDYAALSGRGDLSCARCMVNAGDARVVELWNCVFISHRLVEEPGGYRSPLIQLPMLSVDTGMGLERLASVMQGTMTTYDTDNFVELLGFINAEAGRLIGSPVPYHNSQYFLPVTDHSGCGDLTAASEKVALRTAKPSRLSDLLAHITGRIPKEAKTKEKKVTGEQQQTCSVDDGVLHRDVAYRLLADHSRALNLAMQDGLLPSRQGVGLKLRHLIHRATRAAILTGLDSATKPRLLASIIRGAAPLLAPPRAHYDLEGPSARPRDPVFSVDQIVSVIDQEVQRFVPRLQRMEDAFCACLEHGNPDAALTESQVKGLMSGQYGEPISWDMICAQARWYGLKTLTEPPSHPPTSDKPTTTTTSSSRNGGIPAGPSKSQLPESGRGFRAFLPSLPTTDDKPKYCVQRVAPSSYVVPPLEANLIGLVVVQGANKAEVITDPAKFVDAFAGATADSGTANRLGLLFDRTNFFSPSGGQASDVGFIKSAATSSPSETPVFEVAAVEKIDENNSAVSSEGWVIHWIRPSTHQHHHCQGGAVNSGSPTTLQLCPDSNIRSGIMRHHTAQHLLNWAFEVESTSQCIASTKPGAADGDRGSCEQSSTVYHGSRVDPDRCTLRLTLLESASHLETLVQNAEARCRAVIDAALPVVSQEITLEQVSDKAFVKRFAWEAYPPVVRAVTIGGDLHALEDQLQGQHAFPSAELCGGTHIHRTQDLVDVVVVGLRARKQSVKEFVAIAGEQAALSRDYGQRALIHITTELDTIVSAIKAASRGSEDDLVDCADRLQVLATKVDNTLGGDRDVAGAELPFLTRCALTRCQKRIPLLLGEIKIALRGCQPALGTLDPLIVAQLKRVFRDQNAAEVVVAPFTINRVNRVAQCLLNIAFDKPAVIFHNGFAIFYHPQGNASTLKWTQSTIDKLQLPSTFAAEITPFEETKLRGPISKVSLLRIIPRDNKRVRDWQSCFDRLSEAAISSLHS